MYIYKEALHARVKLLDLQFKYGKAHLNNTRIHHYEISIV